MKKRLLSFVLILSVSPFLTNCATQEEVTNLRYQLRVMNSQLSKMKADTNQQMQQRDAQAELRKDQLEQEIMVLKNQLEETNEANRRLREQNQSLSNNISTVARQEAIKREKAIRQLKEEQAAKEARLNKQLAIQEEKVAAIQQARLRDAERKAKEAKAAARAAKQRSQNLAHGKMTLIKAKKLKVKKAGSTSIKKSTRGKSPAANPPTKTIKKPAQATTQTKTNSQAATKDELLRQAKTAFTAKEYNKSYAIYEKLSKARYDQETTINSLYMMGESRFQQKDYDSAVVRYQDVIRKYPSHSLAASSLYKQALSFDYLKEKETAQMLYKKVIEKYSTSPEASQAKQKITN